MKKFHYYQPQSLKEAYDLMDKLEGLARYIAGGTDILVGLKQEVIRPDALISLRSIDALRGIQYNGGLLLGSMTLLRDMKRDSIIARRFPVLAEAISVLANPQVRNVATVGATFVIPLHLRIARLPSWCLRRA